MSTCQVESYGMCCCICKFHLKDFYHCTTVEYKEREGCVCSTQKGWVCSPPEFSGVYSNWPEHGLCEMYEHK